MGCSIADVSGCSFVHNRDLYLSTYFSSDEADVLLDARGSTNEGGLEKNALVSSKL